MHSPVNINDIIKRAKTEAKVKTNNQLADILDISGSNFSNMKRRGTIINPLIEWAINRRVNLSWLIYGDEKKEIKTTQTKKTENNYTEKLAEWMAEEEREEPRRRAEIELQIERALPEFKEWLERKAEEKRKRKAA